MSIQKQICQLLLKGFSLDGDYSLFVVRDMLPVAAIHRALAAVVYQHWVSSIFQKIQNN